MRVRGEYHVQILAHAFRIIDIAFVKQTRRDRRILWHDALRQNLGHFEKFD